MVTPGLYFLYNIHGNDAYYTELDVKFSEVKTSVPRGTDDFGLKFAWNLCKCIKAEAVFLVIYVKCTNNEY